MCGKAKDVLFIHVMYIYTCTCGKLHAYMYNVQCTRMLLILSHVHTCMSVLVENCVCVLLNTHMENCTYVHVHVHVYTNMYKCIYMYMYMYVRRVHTSVAAHAWKTVLYSRWEKLVTLLEVWLGGECVLLLYVCQIACSGGGF